MIAETYDIALELAAAEAFAGKYEADTLGKMISQEQIIQEAIA